MSIVLEPDRAVVRIPFARTEISDEATEAVARVLESGWVTTGPEVVEFEREFAATVGAPNGIAVSSCTSAIELSLRALRLPPGAKVLTSTMTFCGAVHAIVHAGLQPVLVDVNVETLMPDAATVAAAVRRVKGVDAMVALHFAGQPAEVEEMAAAAELPLTRVIEDAAHAVGTWVGDRPVGAISAATCFSFYATKNLPIGEGGMITTADPEIAEFTRRARLHGMSRDAWKRYLPGSGWRYTVDAAGLKSNMTDLQAAIGRAQLRRLPFWQDARETLARRYDLGLSGIPGIRTPRWPSPGRHGWHLYVIKVDPRFGMDRDSFIAQLADRGVDCSVHFIPTHHQPYFVRLLGEGVIHDFPGADAIFPQIVSLPLYPGLTEEDVDRVAREISDIHRSSHVATSSIGNGTGSGHHPSGHGPSLAASPDRAGLRCLIVGTGMAGKRIAEDLKAFAEFGLHAVGFADDGKVAPEVGVPVLGSATDLAQIVAQQAVDLLIFADPQLDPHDIERLTQTVSMTGVSIRYLPRAVATTAREVRISDLRGLDDGSPEAEAGR